MRVFALIGLVDGVLGRLLWAEKCESRRMDSAGGVVRGEWDGREGSEISARGCGGFGAAAGVYFGRWMSGTRRHEL